WWQDGVFYQIHVRSFYSQENKGNERFGDLKGIEMKLPELKELGVSVIVLNSILKSDSSSSKKDYGYEIVDYEQIDDSIGTMDDFESLVNATHRNGMKLIIEFVPNHVGDKHPWFEEFKKYFENPPTNPTSSWNHFTTVYEEEGGSWKQLDSTNARSNNTYYLHQFLKTQPELNLRSRFIQGEMEKYLKFWTDKDVDGFKIANSDFLFENSDQIDNSPGVSNNNSNNNNNNNNNNNM
ncbi:hypothetical protein HELRODRAFT_78206, partial [Helobdella robusta]|uniref:Glycosyl hydrolase family 13 catalytic domain-containing protein n=1 Tax=Helobdella robusta TaxID=6412 RepID=T1G395_HELRO